MTEPSLDKEINTEVHTDSSIEDQNETRTVDTKTRHKEKIKISEKELEAKLVNLPDILKYIQQLNKLIRKQTKKISRWKLKAKLLIKKKNNVNSYTQTDNLDHSYVIETKNNENSGLKDIVEAAQQAVENSGFVYEESSGLYYDYNSGLYYNAEYGLYYDGKNGRYLKYNQETKDYEFHSQVACNYTSDSAETTKRKHETKKRTKVNSSCNMDNICNSFNHMTINTLQSTTLDLSKRWPPCMRLIIESTDINKLKPGSLYVITCDGGTVGREGNEHAIILPEINVSKHHLKFLFDRTTSKYKLVDLGSRNGTVLDGKRLSVSKQESDAIEILHGSKLQVASTIFLCHIHDGNQTCGHCEPGLLIEKDPIDSVGNLMKITSRQEDYKTNLRKLKKQHGFLHYGEEEKIELASGYTDRAQKRRETIGSQNPYEKTQTASVDENISSDNKGFKLLSKMGWKSGESIGKNGKGLKEPVKVVGNIGTSGIGATTADTVSTIDMSSNKNKQLILKKTQERFETLPDIFTED